MYVPSGIPRVWWTCCTMRRSGLSGVTWMWELRGGLNCEHMQALLTNIEQRHWEWQEHHRTGQGPGLFRHKTAFHGKLGRGQTCRGIEYFIFDSGSWACAVTGLLAEMKDVTGSACFENCETTFRCSKCIWQCEVEASVLW